MQVDFQSNTETEWEKQNPVLLKNQIVKVTDCGKSNAKAYKIGDGFTEFRELRLLGAGLIGYILSEMDYLEV